MKHRIKLGVNIDHVATLRQARLEGIPDLISAVKLALAGGADSIVAHLREDRRHIQDKDIYSIRKLRTHFDMEMAATAEMLKIALDVRPDMATIVPEKRQELTTEGGLDAAANFTKLKGFVRRLEDSGIRVSMFIDPEARQIEASSRLGASFIEIHTGRYARTGSKTDIEEIRKAVKLAKELGLRINAGHGLDYNNVKQIAKIEGIEEFNVGFSIIARSVFTGIKKAVSDMKKLLVAAAALGLICSGSQSLTLEAVPKVEAKPVPSFSDVPSEHWAEYSVSNLVRMGVTQGYPDGTFRGKRSLSRYEMATFLSKMASARVEKAAENEKLNEELKAEVAKLRYTLDMYKNKPEVKDRVFGSFTGRLRVGNVVSANAASSLINAPMGPVFDYRLIANYRHSFNEYTYLRFGIDTMDSSLVGGRDLAREMFEAEGVAETKSGFGVSMTAGPGMVVHREGPSNIFPSEDNKVYLRPSNGIRFYYDPGGWDAGAGYRATAASTMGASAINDVYGYAGYKFKGTFLGDLSLRYSIDSFTNDLKATYSTAESTISIYEIIIEPSKQTRFNIRVGVSGGNDMPHNMFTGLSLTGKEILRKDSSLRLYANKIGTAFFDYPTYPGILGTNLFEKLYQPGTYDYGLEMSQVVSRGFSVKIIYDLVTGANGEYGIDEPKSNGTFELDMDFGLFENAVMTIAYRTYQEPSAIANATSDMLGLGFRYTY